MRPHFRLHYERVPIPFWANWTVTIRHPQTKEYLAATGRGYGTPVEALQDAASRFETQRKLPYTEVGRVYGENAS